MKEQLNPWQVMATHVISYKGEEVKVETIQTINRVPEFFFFVHFANGSVLLNRMETRFGEFWNGSSFSFDEGKKLASAIEAQIGYTLPKKVNNNPFQYKGEIDIKIERFRIVEIEIRRAKAPYSNDIYFEIFLPDKIATLVKIIECDGDHVWSLYEPMDMSNEDFFAIKELLVEFDQAYQLGISGH